MHDDLAVEPVRVPAWGWLALAVALCAIYVVTLDGGAVLARHAHRFHEFVHDGRHFLAVPCH